MAARRRADREGDRAVPPRAGHGSGRPAVFRGPGARRLPGAPTRPARGPGRPHHPARRGRRTPCAHRPPARRRHAGSSGRRGWRSARRRGCAGRLRNRSWALWSERARSLPPGHCRSGAFLCFATDDTDLHGRARIEAHRERVGSIRVDPWRSVSSVAKTWPSKAECVRGRRIRRSRGRSRRGRPGGGGCRGPGAGRGRGRPGSGRRHRRGAIRVASGRRRYRCR